MEKRVMYKFTNTNMTKKEILQIITISALLIANAVLFIVSRNWSALIWEIAFVYCSALALKHTKADRMRILEMQYDINKLRYYSRLSEKKKECYLANCKRAMDNMIKMKEELKQLRVLNKNLTENQYKGKCYGKHANR